MNEAKAKKFEPERNTCTSVFSQRCAGYLMQNGFILVGMEPANDGSRRNVFFFKESPLLHEYINRFKAEFKPVYKI